jgi:uncharacterized membrane protein
MSPLALAISHFLHFAGIAMALGGSVAVQRVVGAAREHSAAKRSGLEIAARKAIVAVELPGLFLAILGGIVAIAINPNHLKPDLSGAGPWLHIKLTLVLALLIVSHLRMFRLARLVRERDAGASEADADALLLAAKKLGTVDLSLLAAIMIVASFRFVFFG